MDGPDLTPCCLLLSGAMGIQESELCSNSGRGQADILICTQLLICGTSFQILPLEECLGREPGTTSEAIAQLQQGALGYYILELKSSSMVW